MNRRCLLFMPGNSPGMLISADVLGADTVVFDLEDAVAIGEKDAARHLVREALPFLPFQHTEAGVRINPLDSPFWINDLEAIVPAGPDSIIIPKASVESVRQIEREIDRICRQAGVEKAISLLVIIETAMGLMDIQSIASCSPRIDALILGAEDLAADLGVTRTKGGKEIEYARFVVATAARAFRMDAIDTPFTDIEDREGLEEDTRLARSIGFSGKLAINPRQVETILDIFSPSPAEIEEARAILQAAARAKEAGQGVFSHRGKMVDMPVIRRAENLLANARRWGLIR